MSCTYDEKSKVWSADPVEPIFNYKNSLGQILHHQLSLYANKVIQIDDTQNRSVTGKEAQTWGVRVAQKLKKMQLNHNHVVGISAQNSTYVLPITLGCFFNATPFHSVNPKLDKSIIEHCFGLTKPAIIFCDGADYEMILEATKSFKPIIYTITEFNGSVPSIEELLKPTETEQHYQPERLVMGIEQTVAVLCSSGTTGKPKAVLISTPCILFDLWFTSSDSCLYSASGLDWITGVMFLVSSCIRGFTRLIFSRSYETQDFLRMVAKYKVTEAFLSSRYLAALIQDPHANETNLASLRAIAFGGSALSETTLNKIKNFSKNQLDLTFFYGMTEVGVVSYQRGFSDKAKSVGKIIENTKIRIVDDNGENLQHNMIGEIFVKTSRPWNGYYGNPDETNRVLDSKGWFRTGDVGYIDADNDLFIVDRKKEILKYQGLQYSPSEIEDAIGELSGIQDFCVASVFDDTRGDVAGALVIKKPGSKLTPQDVIQHVKKRLVAEHKQLNAGVYFVDTLPQNFNGKLLKKEASALLNTFAMPSIINQG